MSKELSYLEFIKNNIFYDIKYFLDFGTLLGIVRDNKILENDDFDFGLVEPTLIDIDKIVLRLNKNGYKCKKIYYKNYVVMLKAFNNHNMPTIDIHIYRYINNRLIFPLYHTPKIKSFLMRSFRRVIRFFYCIFTLQFNNFVPLNLSNKFLARFLFEVKYVIVPYELIFPLVQYNLFPVPGLYREYLTNRYGIWQIRDAKYYFWLDQKDLYDHV